MKQIFAALFLSLIFFLPVATPAPAVANVGGLCSVADEDDCSVTGKTCDPATGACIATGGIQNQHLKFYKDLVVDTINNILVPILIAIAFIVFLWGVFKAYIYHGDDETERKKGHQFVLWGIIGFVVIMSVWGLVNIVKAIFLPTSVSNTAPPTPRL